MENLHDLLVRRHSIRKYKDAEINPDHVKQILEAALLAPTSKNSRSWDFVVVEDKNMLETLSHCKQFGAVSVGRCSLAIVICVDPEKSEAWIEDCAVAATLIQLQAEDLGLGSCWVQVRERFTADGESAEDFVKENLDIPANYRVCMMVTIGEKDEERKPANLDKLFWEKVHIAKFKAE